MNGWQFLAGVVIGGAITLGSYLAILVPARRERTRVREASIAAFEAVVAATEHPRCHVDEEWEGYFIGRRHCSTHDVHWDGGGPCPATSPEPSRDRTRP